MAENQPRILIADDHLLVAEAMKNLLLLEFNVVGVVGDGRTLVQTALEMKPDVVLVDIAMPQLNGLDAGRRIKQALPDTKIIYLTANHDPDVMTEAFAIGASGFVLKTSAFSALIQTIRHALNDHMPAPPPATGQRLDAEVRPSTITLTPRQRDVLQLLAEGLSMKEIGHVLNLATRTVAFHKYRIMETLDLHSNAELVQFAIRKHLVFVDTPIKSHIRMTQERLLT
jgi:DNA-binding NarL/FixJ family response regulator